MLTSMKLDKSTQPSKWCVFKSITKYALSSDRINIFKRCSLRVRIIVLESFMQHLSSLHLIEFRSTVIFLSPRIKYVSIHRKPKRILICETQSHVQFIWIQNWDWRMDVTNIFPVITILAPPGAAARITKTKIKIDLFVCNLNYDT